MYIYIYIYIYIFVVLCLFIIFNTLHILYILFIYVWSTQNVLYIYTYLCFTSRICSLARTPVTCSLLRRSQEKSKNLTAAFVALARNCIRGPNIFSKLFEPKKRLRSHHMYMNICISKKYKIIIK